MSNSDLKKQALRRKSESIAGFRKTGNSINFKRVGVVINSLSFGQRNVFMAMNLNAFVTSHLGTDVQVVVQHTQPPFGPVNFPLRDIAYLCDFDDILVATSLSTCVDCIKTNASKIIFYVSDIDFIDRFDMMYDEIRQCFCDHRVVVVPRCDDYKALIEHEFGIKCKDAVENFQIEVLLGALS